MIVALLLFSYEKTQSIDFSAIEHLLKSLREIKQSDVRINEEVLKSRYNLSKNYDGVNLALDEMNRAFNRFKLGIAATPFVNAQDLAPFVDALHEKVERKTELLNNFRAQNSILKNSLYYIPISADNAQEKLPEDFHASVDYLLRLTLTYLAINDESQRLLALEQSEVVLKQLANAIGELPTEVKIFIKHTKNLLNIKPQLDQRVQQFVNVSFDQNLDEGMQTLAMIVDRYDYQAKLYRLLMYCLSILVLQYTLLSLLRVKLSEWALQGANKQLTVLNKAFERFVPKAFLTQLKKESITEIELGESVKKQMTVLFSDIRAFTSLSEKMTPEQNFQFINSYLGVMGPIIRKHNGFVDKYIGDAIMALFAGDVREAVRAGIEMLQALNEYNQTQRQGQVPIRIGIGIHQGDVMLGMVGETDRMEGTVISDTVNLVSRLESLSKTYSCDLLVSDSVYEQLRNEAEFQLRLIDHATVKGKDIIVKVYEIYNADKTELRKLKSQTAQLLESGIAAHYQQNPAAAKQAFEQCQKFFPDDPVLKLHLKKG